MTKTTMTMAKAKEVMNIPMTMTHLTKLEDQPPKCSPQ